MSWLVIDERDEYAQCASRRCVIIHIDYHYDSNKYLALHYIDKYLIDLLSGGEWMHRTTS